MLMIIFENVHKRYTTDVLRSSPVALRNVTFSLERGATLGFIGANGAGKSTSIRLLMDFIRPDKGTIRLFGRPPSDYSHRSLIGYLPEVASFPANLTILDLIRFTAATCGIPKNLRQTRSEILLNDLGLWEARHKRLSTYSKGMLQRANFILALLNDPQLLILDEPMSGLDPLGREQIIVLIQRLKEQGKTILFCSHILGDVDRLVDKLLILHKGIVLFNGLPMDLLTFQKAATIEEAFINLINRQSSEQHVAS